MMVIAVVALVVIGPERLPRVARTLGFWFGRLQRYVNDVKADINREVELEDLRKFKSQFEEAASGVENEIRSEVAKAETTFNSVGMDSTPSIPASQDPVTMTAAATPEPVTESVPPAVDTAVAHDSAPHKPAV